MNSIRTYFFALIAVGFLFFQFRQVIIVSSFYLNQSEIIEEHCENKDQPEMQCNGKCHLSKELKKSSFESTSLLSTETPANPPVALWFNFTGMVFYSGDVCCRNFIKKIPLSPFQLSFYMSDFLVSIYTPPEIS
jgi:hypothetical protein